MSDTGVQPWLTVVTVVKDDVDGFRSTARSLAGQDTLGVQWVVIDGSTDRSAVPEALASASNLTSDYAWESPSGVYPAMNAGLSAATGEYVYFLNAGDALHTSRSLGIIQRAIVSGPSWLYGQVSFVQPDGSVIVPPPFDYKLEKRRRFSAGRFPPHQGTVAQTALLRRLGGFDTRFRIAADYALFLRLSEISDPIELPDVLADFPVGGLSSTNWRESLAEFHRARVGAFDLSGSGRARDALRTGLLGVRMATARRLGRRRVPVRDP